MGNFFCRFPREDAAEDHPCSQRGKKQPKLCLLHRGVLRRPNTTHKDIIKRPAHQVLANSSGSLAIFGDPPRLIAKVQFKIKASAPARAGRAR